MFSFKHLTGVPVKKTVLILLFLFLAAFVVFQFQKESKAKSKYEIKNLIDQLVKDEVAEQKSLDKLSVLDEKEIVTLYRYLNDRRPLATENIRLLNISSNATEKYYLTRANNVQQVMLRILCDDTGACNGGFDKDDEADVERQCRALMKYCMSRFQKEVCTEDSSANKN